MLRNPPASRRNGNVRVAAVAVLGDADREANLTPDSIARFTFSYIANDQYSSWPTDKNAFVFKSRPGSAWVSMFETYDTSYPCCSIQNARGNSHSKNSPDPCDSGASKICR